VLKQSLWAAGCLSFGLLVGGLLANLVRVEPQPPRVPIEEVTAQIAALSEETHLATLVEAPAAPSETEPDPDREWVEAQAKDLLEQFMAHPGPELDTDQWSRDYKVDASFLIDGTENEWVTVTAARVPCERVDAVLRQAANPDLGQPDRCERWLRAALETMRRHGIKDKSPGEFLAELGADRSVRVMVLYAGWFKDPQAGSGIQLVDARAAFVYPTVGFKEQSNAAQNAIYRAMELGPYAKASTRKRTDDAPAQRSQ